MAYTSKPFRLHHPRIVTTGFRVNINTDTNIELQWDEYYNNNIEALFGGEATIDNGKIYPRLVPENRFNGFFKVAEVYSNQFNSDNPTAMQNGKPIELDDSFYTARDEFARQWAIKARAVMVSKYHSDIHGFPIPGDGAYYETPNVSYCMPVYSLYNDFEVVGYAFLEPYRVGVTNTSVYIPDRIRVSYFSKTPGIEDNAVQDFYFSGNTIGNPDGPEREGIIKDVLYIETRDPVFPTIESSIREINIRKCVQQLATTRSIPHFIVDPSADVDEEQLNTSSGAIISLANGKTATYTEYKAGLAIQLDATRDAYGHFETDSNLPASILGISPSQAESSAAREGLTQIPQAKVNRPRRLLEHKVPTFIRNSEGLSDEEILYLWHSQPFSVIEARREQALSMVGIIIDVAEARAIGGFPYNEAINAKLEAQSNKNVSESGGEDGSLNSDPDDVAPDPD